VRSDEEHAQDHTPRSYDGCGTSYRNDAARLWALWVGQQGGEGIVLKERSAPYRPGRRSPAWLKVKERVVLDVLVEDGNPELVRWGDWGWAARLRLTYTHPRNGIRGTIAGASSRPGKLRTPPRSAGVSLVLGDSSAERPFTASGVRQLAEDPSLSPRRTRKQSAGLLLYRRQGNGWGVFLVHPGGPYWKAKDLGAWSIPKGEFEPGEPPLEAAKREFTEETGLEIAETFMALTPVKQAGGKVVHAFAVEGNCDPAAIKSNTFSVEWPPHSGRFQQFPEVDRAGWFGLEDAALRINKGQRALIDQLSLLLAGDSHSP
jgi:predicted NUDIX family NTP pyrophosphohydrolase